MKTLFITISDGEVSKNILQTSIFAQLKKEFDIVLLVSPKQTQQYIKLMGHEATIEAMPKPPSQALDEFFGDLFLYSMHTQSVRVKIEHSYASGGSILGKSIKNILWFFGRFGWYRFFWRSIYSHVPDYSLDALFTHYRPSVVFAANLTSVDDARLIRAARRFRVKSVGLPKGWDNLTLKTFLPIFPDLLLVQTEFMKQDAIALDYPPTRIQVVGFPKFDIYADKSKLVSRVEFMQAFGLDPARPLILYAGAGDQLAPHDEDILSEFLAAVEVGIIKGHPQVLVRPHPKYAYHPEHIPVRDFWALDLPGKRQKSGDFYFDHADVVHLMNSLYHCDLLIHTASTLGVEAAIFDKPSITLAYDGKAQILPALSTARYNRYEHMQRVIVTGGMKVVENFETLVQYTNEYLQNHSLDEVERVRLVSENAGIIDGKAGDRVVQALRSLIVEE